MLDHLAIPVRDLGAARTSTWQRSHPSATRRPDRRSVEKPGRALRDPAENPQRLSNFYEELFGSRLGARVTIGKQAVPGMGWFAHVLDLEGNPLGIWQSDEGAGS